MEMDKPINEVEMDSEKVIDVDYTSTDEVEEVSSVGQNIGEFFNKIITANTGSGSVDSYKDHPLNFSKSKGLGQVLRGLTGIMGNLELAVIDVVVGAFNMSKEAKNVS